MAHRRLNERGRPRASLIPRANRWRVLALRCHRVVGTTSQEARFRAGSERTRRSYWMEVCFGGGTSGRSFSSPNQCLLSEHAANLQALICQGLHAEPEHDVYRLPLLPVQGSQHPGGECVVKLEAPIFTRFQSFEALARARMLAPARWRVRYAIRGRKAGIRYAEC